MSRRTLLQLGGTVSILGVSGCLRSVSNQSESGTKSGNQRTQSPSTSPGESATEELDTAATELTDAFQLDVSGGNVVAADGNFILGSKDPVRLTAVNSSGNEIWRNEEIHASSWQGLGLAETRLAVCGQTGEITVVDALSGEIQWTFTETEYGSWHGQPVISGSYVAAINREESTTEPERVYVFDIESGDVVLSKDYKMAIGVVLADQRAFVVTKNYLDVYDMTTATREHRVSKFLGGPVAAAGSRLYVGPHQFVVAFDLSEDEPTNVWDTNIRGEPAALQATQDAIYVGGLGGVYTFNSDGERRWWGQTEGTSGRPAIGQETVFATTDNQQLHTFDKTSGDPVKTIELSNENATRPSVAATGDTAVVLGETAQAFTRQSN